MGRASFFRKLEEKKIGDEELVEEAIKDKDVLHELLDGISSPTPRVKFRSAKILRIISARNPRKLYPKWEFFAKLLGSKNRILKWNAIDIIANLTNVDSENRFDELFEKFYGYLYEGSLITAAHVVDNSSTVARAKPMLQDKITEELLKVEKVPLSTEECRNILIGKTIEAFDAYYDDIRAKDEVVSFVKRQLNNTGKATKTKAEKFLRRIEKRQKTQC
ncbi:MAG: hypothetical protein OEY22_11690 [Candidatus Bathyarchaeota archaeon]|nr:hypothetical protein [Candidatus Bathyarchaeota archaeon]MDH5787214.1 hypothetical protein [Candidatus Bathyarchaeota archaeon]